jgi:hypothetical protein
MKRRIRGRAPIARLGLLALVAACRGEARREVHPEADGAATSRPAFVAPSVTLVRVDTVRVTSPVGSDCNRPSWWVGDTLFQMVSNQHPWRSRGGRDAASAQPFEPMRFLDDDPRFRWDEGRQWYVHDINASDAPTPTYMRWMESVYRAPATGVLYGLYHMEEGPYVRCPAPYERPYLSVPHIGLGRSRDNGRTWENLGIIVSDGSFEISCDLPVRFFAGGVGDPSMAIGPDSSYAYIAFTDYSGDDPGRQGIQLARLALADLDQPLAADGTSKARRWHDGAWRGPGLQGTPGPRVGQRWSPTPLGQATPLLPPTNSWLQADGGGYWGPSLSWNTHVGAFMLLLNKVSGARAFDADGNYLAFIPSMESPTIAPVAPIRLDTLPNGPTPAWYVQALGDPAMRGTSAWTGQDARLFLGEHSHLVLRFGAPAASASAGAR